jgi:ferredoxin
MEEMRGGCLKTIFKKRKGRAKKRENYCVGVRRVYAWCSKRLWLTSQTDNQCIDCDLCRETAPSNFGRNDDGGYSFVYKQPASPDEEKLCKEAMEGCPVEAIGDNGS